MIFENPIGALLLFLRETGNTFYMVFVSTLIAIIIGMPIGIILVITEKGGIKENLKLNKVLGTIVNIGRSFPFAILIIALMPFTRLIIGTSIGTTATIVPLSIAAAPFVARVIESSIKEVDKGIIEAAIAMGSTPWEIIIKVLIPEAMSSIILGITLTIINLIGYSAMAGLVGGGGLGNIAIQYGYYRYDFSLMIVTIILLIILVQLIQWIGNSIAKKMNKK
ncbi:methionine ABC transporter permease [Defluviitalea phaphyphila]|uniref:methionine ABC transporter permease n=1 Tax=Defluviitalea phaphyphila TaxID=1473580 RepID=UPI000730C08F|nr:methionine ABC transporter permease [Defluviitalea phaphyphila]